MRHKQLQRGFAAFASKLLFMCCKMQQMCCIFARHTNSTFTENSTNYFKPDPIALIVPFHSQKIPFLVSLASGQILRFLHSKIGILGLQKKIDYSCIEVSYDIGLKNKIYYSLKSFSKEPRYLHTSINR